MRIAILENIRSLHNVGAIFRNADGSGWDKIYLSGYTGCPPDPRIGKVSLGAEDKVEWEQASDALSLLRKLKKEGIEIFALEITSQSKNIFSVKKLPKDFALVLGNEVTGVSREVLSECSRHLMIPMQGKKESLNVSVASGIAFYALVN